MSLCHGAMCCLRFGTSNLQELTIVDGYLPTDSLSIKPDKLLKLLHCNAISIKTVYNFNFLDI